MGAEMDCCKKALAQKQTPEVAAARLCCATNCSQSGTTTPATSLQLSSQTATAPQLPIVAPLPQIDSQLSYSIHPPPKSVTRAYLLNLALLI
jgi:hypothetical protein